MGAGASAAVAAAYGTMSDDEMKAALVGITPRTGDKFVAALAPKQTANPGSLATPATIPESAEEDPKAQAPAQEDSATQAPPQSEAKTEAAPPTADASAEGASRDEGTKAEEVPPKEGAQTERPSSEGPPPGEAKPAEPAKDEGAPKLAAGKEPDSAAAEAALAVAEEGKGA
mmetsp:Transcript_67020/g.188764  ORF Transcript_67020/g.188764 Transcript_67020/m.188764 type:complete len:172 (-) Transcript_67020:284-799(-)